MRKAMIFFGAPGAGKGTQCGLLVERFGFLHVSTGGILRNEIATQSELGKTIKATVESGELVSDEILFAALESYLMSSGSSPVLLDGVPRNTSQVDGLLKRLKAANVAIVATIMLTVDEADLVSRFSCRVTCKKCGYVSSVASDDVLDSKECGECHSIGSLYRREDDKPDVVKRRMRLFKETTEPALAILKEVAPVVVVESSGSIFEVNERVVSGLKSIFAETLELERKLS